MRIRRRHRPHSRRFGHIALEEVIAPPSDEMNKQFLRKRINYRQTVSHRAYR